MTKEELFAIPLPQKTNTYKPVAHKDIYYTTLEELDKHNLVVRGEQLMTNNRGLQVIGYMDIIYGGNKELGMRLVYRNSYDKSMSVGFAAGAVVWICSNGMIGGELNFIKKHVGNVVKEIQWQINKSITELEEHFQIMEKHAKQMKQIELGKTAMAELVGKMYITEELITSTQLNIIKTQINKPSYKEFEDPTLWSLYNYTTESLKKSHPMHYMKNHLNFHDFIETEFILL